MGPHIAPLAAVPGMLDLDVGVIYTYERLWMTPLVNSLAMSGDDLKMRLILIDNASSDGVRAWDNSFPLTKVVRNPVRLHYAANLNRILTNASARYILLLNTDMYFDPSEQCLTKMVRFMDDHPRCGMSICRIYHADGTYGYPARRYPTLRALAARRLGLASVFRADLDAHLYEKQDRYASFECDWISGCFMLMRRDACRQVGPFDELYRKYFEDVDMGARMNLASWRVMFHGGTYAYHYEQRGSRWFWSADAFRHVQSYSRWLYKWGWTPKSMLSAPMTPPVTAQPTAFHPQSSLAPPRMPATLPDPRNPRVPSRA